MSVREIVAEDVSDFENVLFARRLDFCEDDRDLDRSFVEASLVVRVTEIPVRNPTEEEELRSISGSVTREAP
jgi:hypothetical protein